MTDSITELEKELKALKTEKQRRERTLKLKEEISNLKKENQQIEKEKTVTGKTSKILKSIWDVI